MSTNYTGDDTATQAPSPLPAKSATPVIVLPADLDALTAASVHQALKALADGLDALYDRVGWLDSANTFSAQQTFTTAATAISASGKIESTGSAIEAAGNVTSGAQVTAGQFLKAQTARSSATPGSGQSMAAGEVWKDTSLFAYCRLKQTGANTVSVTRSLNLASAPTEAVSAKYVFALQTAAANGLLIFAQVVGAGSFQWTVRPGSLTTSAFEVWTYAGDGTTLTELSVNDELHIMVFAY